MCLIISLPKAFSGGDNGSVNQLHLMLVFICANELLWLLESLDWAGVKSLLHTILLIFLTTVALMVRSLVAQNNSPLSHLSHLSHITVHHMHAKDVITVKENI